MGKNFKIVLKVFLAALIFVFFIIIVALFEDDLEFQYNKMFWEPKLLFNELSPDMTRSDVFFLKGEPDACSDDKARCVWALKSDIGDHLFVRFKNDDVSTIAKAFEYGYSLPFNTVEELKTILGEEDILSISKDYVSRRYTYLEWNITFDFTANHIDVVTIGNVEWRATSDISQYIINGKVICPGENCPWDDEGNLKLEYEGKSYRDFL